MASQLAEANIVLKQRLMRAVAAAVATAWQQLRHYNREQLDQWLSTVLPLTAAANRQTVALTEAFITSALQQQPQGMDLEQIVDGIRNGTPPTEVYTRPLITVWSALKAGKPYSQAVQMGQDRATTAAVTDVQLTFTHTLRAMGSMGDRIAGWTRVPDGQACDFCQAAAGQVYGTGDLAPMHSHCGCGVEPLFAADLRSPITSAPATFDAAGGVTVAVREHGELGPVMTNAADHFTGPGSISGH